MIAGSFGEMSTVIGLIRAPLKQPMVRPKSSKYKLRVCCLSGQTPTPKRVELPARYPDSADL